MDFLTEPEPPRGQPQTVAPGIRRIVAPNPGSMTYYGTNTYLIDVPDGVLVLDPGPEDAAHREAVLKAAGPQVAGILLSHTHHDHVAGLPALRAATGAPVYGWHDPVDPTGTPDVALRDDDEVMGWRALYTPGHALDHLCFAGPGGVLFSADHVMGWSTSVVAPPRGDMSQYFASLRRLLARTGDELYLPGHGPPIPRPRDHAAALLAHRQAREDSVLASLGAAPSSLQELVARLYPSIDRRLHLAAERTLMAHLDKLAKDGRAIQAGEGWSRI